MLRVHNFQPLARLHLNIKLLIQLSFLTWSENYISAQKINRKFKKKKRIIIGEKKSDEYNSKTLSLNFFKTYLSGLKQTLLSLNEKFCIIVAYAMPIK